MNSRNSNESNLVNFSTDLTTLNQLETKDGLLTFPFDHIYACHSDSSEARETLQLDKEVEISTHCVVSEEEALSAGASAEVSRLAERLAAADNQNKRLKELLIYHLDLIQQQNDLIIKKDKSFHALKQENDSLKLKLNQLDRQSSLNQRSNSNPPPLVHASPSSAHTITKTETSTFTSEITLDSLAELLIQGSRSNSILFEGELQKPKEYRPDSFEANKTSQSEVSNYMPELNVVSILDNKGNPCQEFTLIGSKPSFMKKKIETESHVRQDAIYTMTGNSANPVIQRIQRSRKKSGTGSLSRMSKNQTIKIEPESSHEYEAPKSYQRYSVNKKSKTINTYGKSSRSSNLKKSVHYTGSLSDRLQLIDTTPTGEDPYQLGEAEMREQSPIPKLMLQKTNHGRVRICPAETSSTSRNYYDSSLVQDKAEKVNKIKLNRYNLTNNYIHPSEIKKEKTVTSILHSPDLDLVKTETEIDWQIYSNAGNETSLCDFSYGENSNNIASHILPQLDTVQYQDYFTTDSALFQGDMSQQEYGQAKHGDKSNRRAGRTTSLVVPNHSTDELMPKPTDKCGRKRALSTTGVKTIKREPGTKALPKPKIVRGKAKRPVLPGRETRKPYHTLVGDPDVSWYFGLDPDIKLEDVDQDGTSVESTVEVPRWREKLYTSCYTLEGTENLDDKVFEKRHQKLEAEERRQLRWHMRRVREQRHMERLRQRQRDPWSATHQQPTTFTVWPQPQRDLHYIEITDTMPVTAFGEDLPDVPDSNFVLPWVRSSMKRAKRAKTLH